GILLYGPPGTGKTLVARAIANEVKSNVIVVKGPELLSKWFAESARIIRDLFRRAQQLAPCIVFFDEIDALTPKRGGGSHSQGSHERDRIINQLLSLLDGIEITRGVFVIGSTNRPDVIDPAFLRPGRFDRLILVPVPDLRTRAQILRVQTRDMHLKDVDLETIARRTENYTGADLQNLCREAGIAALRSNFESRVVTADDFDKALSATRPSVGPDVIQYYRRLEKEMQNHRVMDYVRFQGEFR
ncbi:MAG TPA: AAA family ATPase, partial [Candidatus Hodarchaeales archaeon]|nr:AAA family ATPase [Candidatus Hodarchaeales archaeon]